RIAARVWERTPPGALLQPVDPTHREALMRLLTVAIVFLAGLPCLAGGTTSYIILCQGKRSGTQTTEIRDDGTIVVDFSFRNNGRGPDIKEELKLAEDGTPLRYSGKGKSTFGGPIAEEFFIHDGIAEWSSVSESGKAKVEGVT